MSQGNPRATPSTRPVGALMRIEEAAKELGLEVVDLLEYAEEREGHGAPLRVCAMMPIDWPVEPSREPIPLLEDLSPAERRFAFVDTPNTPGFFLDLAARGVAVPNIGDFLSMVDGSGFVWAYDVEIRLEGLRVPREDVERLKTHLTSDGATMPEVALGADATEPTGKRNARWVGIAKTLVKNDPGHFLDSNGKPVWKRLAEELERQGHAKGLKMGTLRDILRDNWGS
jgi:hypothetical protein